MKITRSQAIAGLLCIGMNADVLAQQRAVPPCGERCTQFETLKPRFFTDLQSRRILSKYGPFSVQGTSQGHGMQNYDFLIAPPCEDCLITHAQADLKYPDGSNANANTGMYLHHVVIFNLNRTATSCPQIPEYVFASGNERMPVSISVDGTRKAGYRISKGESFILTAEFMNDRANARDAVIAIDWEWVPLASAADFRPATPIWLDVDGACLTRRSEVPVPAGAKAFSLVMEPPWTSQVSGDVLTMVSHLHDGGEDLQVLRNGVVACNSRARYGEKPAFVSPGDHSGHSGRRRRGATAAVERKTTVVEKRDEDKPRLSSMVICSGTGRVEIGDKWSVKANYNFTRYAPMEGGGHHGDEPQPVMGITLLYIAKDVN